MAAIVSTVLVVAIIMGAYVFTQRRRRAALMNDFTDLASSTGGHHTEKGQISRPVMQQTTDSGQSPLSFFSTGLTKPTQAHLGRLAPQTPMSPEFISYHDRGTEWRQQLESQPTRRPSSSRVAMKSPLKTSNRSRSSQHPSLISSEQEGDMDIEQILDMARMYTQPNSPEYSIDLTRQSSPDSIRTWNRSRANSISTVRMPVIPDEAEMPVSQWAGNQTARRLGGRSGSLKYSTPGAQVQKIDTPLPSAVDQSNRI